MIHNFHDISCLKDPEIEPDSYFDIHILVSLEANDKIRDNTYLLSYFTLYYQLYRGCVWFEWKKMEKNMKLPSAPYSQV